MLPSRQDSPQSAASLTQSMAQELDPLGTRQDASVVYLVDGTGTDQLSDSTPAGIIHLHTNPLDAANVEAALSGAALVTTKGDLGAMVIVLCPTDAPPTCLSSLLAYARTIRLASS